MGGAATEENDSRVPSGNGRRGDTSSGVGGADLLEAGSIITEHGTGSMLQQQQYNVRKDDDSLAVRFLHLLSGNTRNGAEGNAPLIHGALGRLIHCSF